MIAGTIFVFHILQIFSDKVLPWKNLQFFYLFHVPLHQSSMNVVEDIISLNILSSAITDVKS